jgi:hypothetical protein
MTELVYLFIILPVYSVRKARIGEMTAARAAGMIAARNEEIVSAQAAAARASGSQGETP